MSSRSLRNRGAAGTRTFARALGVVSLLLFGNVSQGGTDVANSAALERLMAEGVPVVDVRTRGEWEETGVIDGAHLLTFFDEKGRYDWGAWLASFQEIAAADQPVVLMCHSGVRSAAIAEALTGQAGYVKVYDYQPGIEGWLQESRPTVPPPSGDLSQ